MSTRPEDVGLSSERLARIDAHLKRRYLDPEKVPGCLTLVARGGHLAWLSPQGLMDRERGKPMASDTIFRIFSMSKPVTSVALMMLYEHGHFQLTDAVEKFIPEWKELRVFQAGSHPNFATRPCERPMTIADLLCHTSGLTYGFLEQTNVDRAYRKLGIGSLRRTFDGDLQGLVEALAGLPLEFSPGTAWNYSVSTDVVGHLVEVISGERFDEYLRRHLFEPLGMLDTGFSVPAESADRFAAFYQRDANKQLRLRDDPQQSAYLKPQGFLSGGGGLVSTAHDYLRFCHMLLGGGELDGVRVLGRRTIELMTRNHLPNGEDLTQRSVGLFAETSMRGTGFGLGFAVNLGPVRTQAVGSAGEYSWGGAASTIFWVDPAEELVVIFLTQFFPSRTFDFRGQLKSIVYSAITD